MFGPPFADASASTMVALAWLALCIGVCTSLSIFATLAVLKAFRLRTRRWIILGGVGGLFLLVAWVLVVGVTIAAIYDVAHNRQEKQVASASTKPQIIRGQNLPYHFVLPAGWKIEWNNKTYDLVTEHEGLHVAFVAGKSVGNSAKLAEMSRDKIRSESTEASLGEKVPVEIDGRSWLRYAADFRFSLDSKPHHQWYHVYSGDDGMFQIIAWRDQAFQPGDADALRPFINSFRFPLTPDPWLATSPATTQTGTKTLSGTRANYSITIPGGWLVQPHGENDYDLAASHDQLHVSVIAEPEVATSSAELLRFVQLRARRREAITRVGGASTVRIDNRDWLRFSAQSNNNGVLYVEDSYVYAGVEGAFQLLGMTCLKDYAQDEAMLNDVVKSFRFPPTKNTAPQTVEGQAVPFQLTLPAGWRAKYPAGVFDVFASQGSLFFGVSAEKGEGKTSQQLLVEVQDKLRESTKGPRFGETSTVQIDGRPWLQFSMQYASGGSEIDAVQSLYVGPEGRFQLMGWTTQGRLGARTDLISKIAGSFRFPPGSAARLEPTATPSPQPPAKSPKSK